MVHFRFVCQLYQMQLDAGRYFLHEHPVGATSWKEKCVEEIWQHPSVERIISDQCQFGQQHDGEPVMKPTGWMSNAPHILQQLNKRCQGPRGLCSATGTPHRHALGKVARDAAIYPFLLCKAILVGLCKQLREDGHLTAGSCGFTSWNETMENLSDAYINREAKHILALSSAEEEESEEEPPDEARDDRLCYATPQAEKPIKDAMSGQILDRGLVAIARQKELKYFLAKEVWLKRPRNEAYQVTGKRPISVK